MSAPLRVHMEMCVHLDVHPRKYMKMCMTYLRVCIRECIAHAGMCTFLSLHIIVYIEMYVLLSTLFNGRGGVRLAEHTSVGVHEV